MISLDTIISSIEYTRKSRELAGEWPIEKIQKEIKKVANFGERVEAIVKAIRMQDEIRPDYETAWDLAVAEKKIRDNGFAVDLAEILGGMKGRGEAAEMKDLAARVIRENT